MKKYLFLTLLIGLSTAISFAQMLREKFSDLTVVTHSLDVFEALKDYKDFKVIPFSNPDIANYLSDYKNVYETYKKVVQDMDSSMYVKELASE